MILNYPYNQIIFKFKIAPQGAIFLPIFSPKEVIPINDRFQDKETLYIPLGLKPNPEIFDGFGKEELFKSAITSIIVGAIDIVFYLLTKNVAVCIVIILSAIAGSVMAFTKDKTNLSVADQIWNMIRYSKMQKKYTYKYLDEWEVSRK